MLDIDRFTPVNDTYGHEAGDMVLKHVAGVVKASAREADLVAPSWRRRISFGTPRTLNGVGARLRRAYSCAY